MIIAPRDFWRLSSWQVFKKKMGYAFSAYLIVTLVAAGVFGAIFS
jgi:mannose/fructose/N-acetylgalactosamine-specific phosphotransferase system component IIC